MRLRCRLCDCVTACGSHRVTKKRYQSSQCVFTGSAVVRTDSIGQNATDATRQSKDCTRCRPETYSQGRPCKATCCLSRARDKNMLSFMAEFISVRGRCRLRDFVTAYCSYREVSTSRVFTQRSTAALGSGGTFEGPG